MPPRTSSDDLTFVVAGLVVWRLVIAALSAFGCIVDNANVVTKVYFPREVIPLGAVLAGTIDLAVTAGLGIAVASIEGVRPSLTLIALPVPIVIAVIGCSSLAILGSTLNVFVRDISYGTGFIGQALFFSAPIMYPASKYGEHQWLVSVNPLAATTEAVRDVMLRGEWPDWWLMGAHLAVGLAILALALAYLRSVEHRIPDLV